VTRASPIGRLPALVCTAFGAIAATLPLSLLAQGSQTTRVLLVTNATGGAPRRTASELRMRGYEAIVATERQQVSPDSLSRAAKAHDADLIVAIVDQPPTGWLVSIWLPSSAPGEAPPRLVDQISAVGATDREVAWRIAEIVHARRTSAAELAMRETPTQIAGKAFATFELDAAAAAMFAPAGNAPPMAQLWLSASWLPRRWFALELLVQLPLVPARVQAPAGVLGADSPATGEADLFVGLVGGGARFRLCSSSDRVAGSIGVGGGALVLNARGTSSATSLGLSQGRTEWAVAGAAFGRAGLSWRVWRHLRLFGDALLGVAVPRFAIAIGSETVATWGRPFLGLAAGLGWDWL